MMNKVAVLLAAYNGEKYITEQVNTILKQRGVKVTLFISVQSGWDETLVICKKLANSHKNVHLVDWQQAPQSAFDNFKHLLQHAPYNLHDFVAFADQDDIWLEEKLEQAIRSIESSGAVGYSSNLSAFWDDDPNRTEKLRKSSTQKEFDFLFESASAGCTYVTTSDSIAMFKNFVEKNQCHLKDFKSFDWLLYAFYRYKGLQWVIDNRAFILYRQHSSNTIGANLGLKRIAQRIFLDLPSWYLRDVKTLISLFSCKPKITIKTALKKPFQFRRNHFESLLILVLVLIGAIP